MVDYNFYLSVIVRFVCDRLIHTSAVRTVRVPVCAIMCVALSRVSVPQSTVTVVRVRCSVPLTQG